jgi:hypothetical protein
MDIPTLGTTSHSSLSSWTCGKDLHPNSILLILMRSATPSLTLDGCLFYVQLTETHFKQNTCDVKIPKVIL